MDTKDIILKLRTKLGFSQEELAEKDTASQQAMTSFNCKFPLIRLPY